MTWGFRLVLFWSFISVFCLLSALAASYQHLRDRDRRGRSHSRQQQLQQQRRLRRRKLYREPVSDKSYA